MRSERRMPAFVRVVGLAISLAFVLMVAGSFLLPAEVRVVRSTVVDRSPEVVYGLLEANLVSGHEDGVRRAVVERVPNARMRLELDYGRLGKAFDTVELSPRAGGTEVVRRYQQALGRRPLRRWSGLRLKAIAGAELERELAKLRADAEAG